MMRAHLSPCQEEAWRPGNQIGSPGASTPQKLLTDEPVHEPYQRKPREVDDGARRPPRRVTNKLGFIAPCQLVLPGHLTADNVRLARPVWI